MAPLVDYIFSKFSNFKILSAAAAGLAISAALFYGFSRRGKHCAAVTSFGRLAAIGADYLVGCFLYKFFKFLAAYRASVL